jgi:hypothetical protein
LLEVVRRSMKIVACILGACVYSASRQHHISYMFEFVVSFSLSFFLVAETGAKYIVFFCDKVYCLLETLMWKEYLRVELRSISAIKSSTRHTMHTFAAWLNFYEATRLGE